MTSLATGVNNGSCTDPNNDSRTELNSGQSANPCNGQSANLYNNQSTSLCNDQSTGLNSGPLHIESLTVRRDRIVCSVVVDAPNRNTTEAFAKKLLQKFPSLAHHACVNNVGDTFGCVIAHTSLAHVLEHLVIDLQVREAHASPHARYVGTTVCTNKMAGQYRVEVSFTDDLVALRAFRVASEEINSLVLECGNDYFTHNI